MQDRITKEAQEICHLLDDGRAQEATRQLQDDLRNMQPKEYLRLLREIDERELKSVGLNLGVAQGSKEGLTELRLVDSHSDKVLGLLSSLPTGVEVKMPAKTPDRLTPESPAVKELIIPRTSESTDKSQASQSDRALPSEQQSEAKTILTRDDVGQRLMGSPSYLSLDTFLRDRADSIEGLWNSPVDQFNKSIDSYIESLDADVDWVTVYNLKRFKADRNFYENNGNAPPDIDTTHYDTLCDFLGRGNTAAGNAELEHLWLLPALELQVQMTTIHSTLSLPRDLEIREALDALYQRRIELSLPTRN